MFKKLKYLYDFLLFDKVPLNFFKLSTLVSLINEQALIKEQGTKWQGPPFSYSCSKKGQTGWKMTKNLLGVHACLLETPEKVNNKILH